MSPAPAAGAQPQGFISPSADQGASFFPRVPLKSGTDRAKDRWGSSAQARLFATNHLHQGRFYCRSSGLIQHGSSGITEARELCAANTRLSPWASIAAGIGASSTPGQPPSLGSVVLPKPFAQPQPSPVAHHRVAPSGGVGSCSTYIVLGD